MAKVRIQGREYDSDDLTLDEVELLEETLDAALDDVDFRRARVLKAMVFVFMRRDDPELTLEDVGAIKIAGLFDDDQEADDPPPLAAGGTTGGENA